MRINTNRILFRLGWGIFIILSITRILIPTSVAVAHPADMYAQDQTIQINQDTLEVEWKITPGPVLAGTLWDNADLNRDGAISPQEAQAWAQPYLPQWQVSLDGQPIQSASLKSIQWPTSIDNLQTGDQPIDIVMDFQLPTGLSGSHLFEFHNTFQESISLNWFSLKSEPGIAFDEPDQNNGQLTTHINFSSPSGASSNQSSSGLSIWESGNPTVPGLTSAVSSLAINLANSQNSPSTANSQNSPVSSQPQASVPASPTSALTSLMKAQNFTPLFLAGAFLLSLVLGCLHALTPGHGKTLVAAYLVGSHGKTRDAVFLGSVVTVTHTGSVLLLGFVTLIASRYILPAIVLPWLEVISGLFVILFGINLILHRGKSLINWSKSQRDTPAVQHFVSVTPLKNSFHHASLIATPHSHQGEIPHVHAGNLKSVSSIHDHEHHSHGHTHGLPVEHITWRSLLALGISGGLVPCPDAIAILLVTVAVNRIPLGMLLIVAFSLGLALVLIGIGIAMVRGFRLLQRNELINRISIYSPIASSVVVLGLGIGLTVSAFSTVPVSAGTNLAVSSQTPESAASVPTPTVELTRVQTVGAKFVLDQARIFYIAQDAANFYQLFSTSISGSDPIQYTHEPAGIQGYFLSPDKQTILYLTLKSTGDTSFWMIGSDGTGQRLVLDCPTAYCGGAVWSPDEQKLIYERNDYNQSTNLGLYSLWWLDLKTGETKPVFRDQSFPGFAAAFSADGKWLSYISPSNNTIQIFSLAGEQGQSIPYWSGMPEKWSPVDDSFLYWDLDTTAQQAVPQLKRYDLATGKIYNLSGAAGQEDYPVAWSPDGQWIAIARNNLSSQNAGYNEQIWLVKPDGTRAHVFLNLDGINYSDISWSPDSQKLVYSRYTLEDKGKEEIWMADVSTGQQTRLISDASMPVILP